MYCYVSQRKSPGVTPDQIVITDDFQMVQKKKEKKKRMTKKKSHCHDGMLLHPHTLNWAATALHAHGFFTCHLGRYLHPSLC